MADDQADVVIVDDAGTTHRFPAGFDPKRAAAIVRGQTVTPVSASDILSGSVGRDFHLSDNPTEPAGSGLMAMLRPLAHPQTAGDFLSLLIPNGATEAAGTAIKMLKAGAAEVPGGPAYSAPGRILRGMYRYADSPAENLAARSFNDLPLAQQMDSLPTTTAPETRRFPEPPLRPIEANPAAELVQTATPSRIGVPRKQGGAKSAQYDELKAAVDRGELSPNVLAAYEAKYGGMQPMASHVSTIQARPDLVPVGEEAIHNSVRPVAPPIADPATIPMRQPRIDIGAEKVGRQAGLSKEEVRQQTGPILGEEPGSASPILPQKALERIVSDMRQLSPGPEREAYVARATSGKAQWQIENIRRTLQALGLLVPIGVASRDELMNQLRQRSTDGGSTSLSAQMQP